MKQGISAVLHGAGTFAAAIFMTSGLAYAGCTANLTADRELNIRSGPSSNYEPVGRIPGRACGIRIRDCDDGWCRVNYEGLSGYSSEFYLRRTADGRDRDRGVDEQQVLREWLGIAQEIFAQLANDPDWENLGTLEVTNDRERSVLQLDRRDGRFDALRMRVRGNDVNFRRVVVVYGNGRRDNLDLNRVVEAGEETGEIEFRGRNGRFLDRIIIVHEKARRRGRPAEIQVWAHKTSEGRVGRGPGRDEQPNFGRNWERLGTKVVDRSRDREVIQLNRKDGSFDKLRLRVLDNDVRIRRVRVQYGNGVAHDLDVDRRITVGEHSGDIELRGRRGRFIDRVVLVYDTVGRGPKATVELWGHSS
jgi:hypothetical protein